MQRLSGWPLTIATAAVAALNVVVATLDAAPEWLQVVAAAAVAVGAVLGVAPRAVDD